MSHNKSQGHAQAVLNTARGADLAAWMPYAALFIGDPRTTGVEANYAGYARQALTFAAPIGQYMSASEAVVFPAPGAPLAGGADWFAVFDDPSGGALRYAGRLDNPQSWVAGRTVRLAAGAITVGEF